MFRKDVAARDDWWRGACEVEKEEVRGIAKWAGCEVAKFLLKAE